MTAIGEAGARLIPSAGYGGVILGASFMAAVGYLAVLVLRARDNLTGGGEIHPSDAWIGEHCRELFWSLSLLLVLFCWFQLKQPAGPIWLRSNLTVGALHFVLETDFLLCVLCFWQSGAGRVVYAPAMIILGLYTLLMPLVVLAQALQLR